MQVISELICCACEVLNHNFLPLRLSYTSATLPRTLIDSLDETPLCSCGTICFATPIIERWHEAKIHSSNIVKTSQVTAFADGTLCSSKCVKRYGPFVRWIKLNNSVHLFPMYHSVFIKLTLYFVTVQFAVLFWNKIHLYRSISDSEDLERGVYKRISSRRDGFLVSLYGFQWKKSCTNWAVCLKRMSKLEINSSIKQILFCYL